MPGQTGSAAATLLWRVGRTSGLPLIRIMALITSPVLEGHTNELAVVTFQTFKRPVGHLAGETRLRGLLPYLAKRNGSRLRNTLNRPDQLPFSDHLEAPI